MRNLSQHFPMHDLWVCEYLGHVVDRRSRNARGIKSSEEFLPLQLREGLAEQASQFDIGANACSIARKTRVGRPGVAADHTAHFRELSVVADRKYESTVFCGKHVLRLDIGM